MSAVIFMAAARRLLHVRERDAADDAPSVRSRSRRREAIHPSELGGSSARVVLAVMSARAVEETARRLRELRREEMADVFLLTDGCESPSLNAALPAERARTRLRQIRAGFEGPLAV